MDLPVRKSIRLKGYDYSAPGAYFLTVCTRDRRCILSDITAGPPGGDAPSPPVGAGVLDGPQRSLASSRRGRRPRRPVFYSTVTDFARFFGLSISQPLAFAT